MFERSGGPTMIYLSMAIIIFLNSVASASSQEADHTKQNESETVSSKAGDFVQQSHNYAKLYAASLYNQMLFSSMKTQIQRNVTQEDLQKYSTELYRALDDIKFRLNEYNNDLSLVMANDAPISVEDLEIIYDSLHASIARIRTSQLNPGSIVNSFANLYTSQVRTIEGFQDNVEKICRIGLAVPLNQPLPFIPPNPMPEVQVYFQKTLTGDSGSDYQNSNFGIPDGDSSRLAYTGSFLTGVIVSSSLIEGQLILSGAQFASIGLASQLTALAAGLVAAAAVMAVMATIKWHEAVSKSKEQAKELYRMWSQQAGSEDVRQYFKEYCSAHNGRILDLKANLELIKKNDPEVLEKLASLKKTYTNFSQKYFELNSKVQAKLAEIRSRYSTPLSEKDLSAINEAYTVSSEFKELDTFVKNLEIDDLHASIEYLLLNSFSIINQNYDAAIEQVRTNSLSIELHTLERQVIGVRRLLLAAKMAKLFPNSELPSLKEDYSEMVSIKQGIDRIFVDKLSSIAKPDACLEDKIKNELSHLILRVKNLKNKLQTNKILNGLESQLLVLSY